MGYLDNCSIKTARAQSLATGATTQAIAYLQDIPGHIGPYGSGKYGFKNLQEAALESEFVFVASPDLEGNFPDIKTGDQITGITLLKNGKQWPGYNPNETFYVEYTITNDPGPLYNLFVFIARETGGGPLY